MRELSLSLRFEMRVKREPCSGIYIYTQTYKTRRVLEE